MILIPDNEEITMTYPSRKTRSENFLDYLCEPSREWYVVGFGCYRKTNSAALATTPAAACNNFCDTVVLATTVVIFFLDLGTLARDRL